MNEVLADIFKDAGNSGEVNLLGVLKSYEKVIQSRKILYYSEEGAEIYRNLLLWGRENPKNLTKKPAPGPSKLQISDLSPTPPPQVQSNPIATSNSQYLQKTADFSLPSFKSFEKQSKTPSPNQTLAEAFNTNQIKSRIFSIWKQLQAKLVEDREQELKKIEKTKKYSKTIQSYIRTLYRKSLRAWTRFNLIQVQKNIAEQMDNQIRKKKFWTAWQVVQKKREILKGMKFTACFIHKQWLMKKALLVFTRFVHGQMINKLKIGRVRERVYGNLIGKMIRNWKIFVNLKLVGKVFKLRSQKLLIRNLRKRGLLMLANGCEVSQEESMKKSLALGFSARSCYQKVIGAWFLFIVSKKRMVLKEQKALAFRNKQIIRECFEWFRLIIDEILDNRKNVIEACEKKKLGKCFLALKGLSEINKVKSFEGKFYFCCYLMLGEGDNFNFGKKNFSVKKIKREKAAIDCLKKFIKERFFLTFKNNSKALKAFRSQRLHKQKTKIFSYWKKKAIYKAKNSYNLAKITREKRKNLALKIFRSWSKKYLKIRLNKLIYKQYSIEKQERTLTSSIKIWVNKLKKRLRHKHENSLAPVFKRHTLLNKYLIKWSDSYKKLRKKNHLSHKSKLFFLTKFTSKAWSHWRKIFIEKIKMDYKSTKVSDIYSSKLLNKTFKNLKKIAALCKCKRFKIYKSDDQHEWVLKVKSIKSWTQFISYFKSKTNLYGQLSADRNKLISSKILKFLKIYSQYRIKNRARDDITYTQLTKNRKKYLMQFWYKKALLFSSVRYFTSIFNSLLKKSVINSIQKYIEIQKVTLAYLEVFREESRIKSTFNAWKRILSKKKKLAQKMENFRKVEEKYSKLKPFKIWSKKFEKNKIKVELLAKILRKIFVFMRRRKFLVWKKVIIRDKKRNEAFLYRGKFLKKMVFLGLRRAVEEIRAGIDKANELNGLRTEKVCRKVFDLWKRRGVVIGVIRNCRLRAVGKYFKSIFKVVSRKRYANQVVSEMLVKSSKKRFRKVFGSLVDYKKKCEKIKIFRQKYKKIGEMQMVDVTFASFKKNHNKKKEKLQKNKVSHNHFSITMMKKVLIELKNHKNKFKQFILQKKQTESKFLKQKVLNFLKTFRTFSKTSKIHLQKAQSHYNSQLKSVFFQKLQTYIHQFRQSKLSLLKKQSLNLLKCCFNSLSNYIFTKRQKNSLLLEAKAHFDLVLKQKTLRVLNKARLKFKSIKNHKTQKLSSRLLEQSLQSMANTSLSKTQKTNLAIALTHYYSNILSKFFLLLMKHKNSSKAFKLNTKKGFLGLSRVISQHLKLSIFTDLQQLFIIDKKLTNKAEKHFKSSTLTKGFKIFAKIVKNNKKIICKQEIINIKHAKNLRKGAFFQWLKAMRVKTCGKRVEVNNEFLLVKKLFSKWVIELKIKEMQKNRLQKLKIFALAGLQIYSEKTFQAKVHLNNFNILQTFSYMKQVFKSWNTYKCQKQMGRFYLETYQNKLKKMALAGFKDYFYQVLIQNEVLRRCKKNFTHRFIRNWRLALKKRLKGKKILKKLTTRKNLRIKSISFGRWLHGNMSRQSNIEAYTIKIHRKKVNKTENLAKSEKFYKDGLMNKMFLMWDQYVSQHSIKRRRAFVYSIFFGWKVITRENSLLRKYLIESNLSERYLRSSVETGAGMLKSMSSLGSFHSIN